MNFTLLVLIGLAVLVVAVLATGFICYRILRKRILRLAEENRSAKNTIRQLEDILHKKNQRNDAERAYWEAVAIEKEQRRIASELHDDTVQRMVAARFRLEQILYYQNHPGVVQEVEQIRKELDQIIAALRFLINNMIQPRFQQHSLIYLLKELTQTLGSLHHQTIGLEETNPHDSIELTSEIKQELYYIVHELVHNSLKNSTGFNLRIQVFWKNGLHLCVSDNGQGLGRGRGYGIGMRSIQNRADKIGAKIDFEKVTRGLSVAIYLPGPVQQSIPQ